MPIGKLEPFELTSKQWPAYIRRVRQYILLNEVRAELEVPLLITVVGDVTYGLMCDLCSPDLPEEKLLDELVELVTGHMEPQRSEIAERHVFRLRRQRVGEPLAEYLQNLKHLASTCSFGATLEENLRDQFVSGLASEVMRSRIFAEKSIQYKEAVELALALEAAEKHAEVSGADAAPASTSGGGGGGGVDENEDLHHASARRGRRGGGRGTEAGGGESAARRDLPCSDPAQCWRCGRAHRDGAGGEKAAARRNSSSDDATECWRCGKAHKSHRCKYAQYNCDKCHQRGHLRVMCDGVRRTGLSAERQNFMCGESDDDFFHIQESPLRDEPFFCTVNIDGQDIVCEIDTGSRISAINEAMYRRKFASKLITADNLNLHSYNGSQIQALGCISVDVTLNDVTVTTLPLYIIKNGARPLLGREWMRALKLNQVSLNVVDDGLVTQPYGKLSGIFTDHASLRAGPEFKSSSREHAPSQRDYIERVFYTQQGAVRSDQVSRAQQRQQHRVIATTGVASPHQLIMREKRLEDKMASTANPVPRELDKPVGSEFALVTMCDTGQTSDDVSDGEVCREL